MQRQNRSKEAQEVFYDIFLFTSLARQSGEEVRAFLISLSSGFITSLLFEPRSYWGYLLSSILIAVLVFLVALLIGYPFPILPFKGVKPVKRKKKILSKNILPSALESLKNEIKP